MVLVVSMVLFFIPMVTAGFASKLIVDRNAFTHEEQEELKDGIRRLLRAIESEEGRLGNPHTSRDFVAAGSDNG
jgi:voltage-gated potassium channel